MKRRFLILPLFLAAIMAYSQESRITAFGGYTFANIEEADTDGTGWRVGLVYEFTPMGTKFGHGMSASYVSLSAENSGSSYDIATWPVYYAPKFMFGSDKFQGFIKAALGWQFSKVSRTGNFSELETNDSGLATGVGAGFLFYMNDKVFLDAGYEFLWLQNSFFRDGYLNTASLGIGFKF
jgi:hypothetical protein